MTKKLCILLTLALFFTFAFAVKNNPTASQDANTRFQKLKHALQLKQKKIQLQNHDLQSDSESSKKKKSPPKSQDANPNKNFYAQFVYVDNPPVAEPKKASKISPSRTPSHTPSASRPKKRTHSRSLTQTATPSRPKKRTHSKTSTQTITPTQTATPSHKKKGKVPVSPSRSRSRKVGSQVTGNANTNTDTKPGQFKPYIYHYDFANAPPVNLPKGTGNQGQAQNGKAKPALLKRLLKLKMKL